MTRKMSKSSQPTLRKFTSQSATEFTAPDKTALTSNRTTVRRGRPRHCKWCGEPFKGMKSARYCSTSCRQKAYRHRLKKQRSPAPPPELTPMVCVHCSESFWSQNQRRQQRYCSPSCKSLAYRVRRLAAIVALAEFLGISQEKAEDVADAMGIRAITDKLTVVGFIYDEAIRAWVMPLGHERVFAIY
jgi:hypothetical protein